ncbi:MAG: PAS domain-containing protein [Campylobacterales bacterium]|nr:PAS domain-containing protein [Campylobacterales bacterium]
MSINLGNKQIHLDDSIMIVTETDDRGKIIFSSRDFCQISGYCEEELIGQSHNIVRHPFMPRSAFEQLWQTVKKGNVWNGIVVNKTKHGDYYWVNSTVFPSKQKDGSTKYISVRTKASDEEIQNVISVYKKI